MLKGQVFANQLFENQIFALFINTFADGTDGVSNNYKNGMAITYSGSDVTIDSGAILIQGRLLEEDTSTTISAGADNMYCKLVIEIDLDKTNTTTEFNQGTYKIIKGANSYPALTQTNIVKNNAGVYQYELARFRNPSTGITDFQDMRTFIDFTNIYEEIRQHIQAIDDESIFVLKSGSTMTGKLIAEGGVEGNVQGNLTGNVTGNCSGTASRLATARTIALSGDVSGSISFDGSANKTMTTALQTNNGSDISVPLFDTSDGTCTIKFCRRGHTVHMECWMTINANHQVGMVTEEVTIPDWAKTTMADTGHLKPLITGVLRGNNMDTTEDNSFAFFKAVNGKYYVQGLVHRSVYKESGNYYCSGTYIV